MTTSEIILNYANSRDSFSLTDLSVHLQGMVTISSQGILWHLKKLIKENKIMRLNRGLYGNVSKRIYKYIPSAAEKNLYSEISKEYNYIDICIYYGSVISSMQHHLSVNNALYIEVTKEATEAVFHFLLDKGYKAYHKPTQSFMSDYVNLSEGCIIVKPLITESPLIQTVGVKVPALEKILVDINCDPDFYYLQGGESFYILEHCLNLYNINIPRMLRYASRRGRRHKITEILNYKEI